MPITRYTKWIPSPLDGLSLEQLMDELSEFFLQSGFDYGFQGSTNPHNLVKATLDALTQLRSRQEIERLRGVSLS